MKRVNMLLYYLRSSKIAEVSGLFEGSDTLLQAVVKCSGAYPNPKLQDISDDGKGTQPNLGEVAVTGDKGAVRVTPGAELGGCSQTET